VATLLDDIRGAYTWCRIT